ncbi:MAG: hypothetical protein O8C63_12685 [Candidatus Methanoperedens sp.]|nr:hypothetical protein [Candidatus Methanoperedens sp.]
MDKKILLLFAIFGILLAASMFTTYAIFSGSHTVYKNTTPATAADFCFKCHPTKVSIVNTSAHANAGCICHGYNPNINETYNLNAAHNLTKQIYCTNCHSNYTISTGKITIHNDVGLGEISGINQSAHYIIASSSNKTPVYDRAKQFFANSSG